MTAEQFAYWLQGYAELTDAAPTPEQWQSIREHLALVFNKQTPAAPWANKQQAGTPFGNPPWGAPNGAQAVPQYGSKVIC